MANALRHRGPDDEGYHLDGPAGLAVCRLSIVDLAGGHQPIGNAQGTRWVALNGEIYNFRELRASLESRGMRFRTGTDTEVVLRQYEADGAECVRRFNGMFAFAVWDAPAQRLFMARDRLGVKPLFYYWDGRQLLFASELKALLASGLVPREADEAAIWDYLTFRYVPQPNTIWRGVRKLPPGHTLTLDAGKPPVLQRYWDIPYVADGRRRPWREYDEEFQALFDDAIRLRLRADVPVGVLLSGGLDSSSVAAAAASQQRRIDSFTVGFDQAPGADERPYARAVAEAIGATHHETTMTAPEYLALMPEMVRMADEPLADPTCAPLFCVTRAARGSVKVLLSGEGSDEVLGGYHFDRLCRNWDALRWYQRLPRAVRHGAVQPLADRLHPSLAARVAWANTPLAHWGELRPMAMTNFVGGAEKASWWRGSAVAQDSLETIRRTMSRVRIQDPLHQALYVACQDWLADDLLAKADRMSMANSIELRTPFLDYRLVEWAARAPSAVKVGRAGWRYQTKRVLRRYAASRLPAEVLRRPKQGFPVPVYQWVGGPWRSWVEELLRPGDACVRRWIADDAVERVVRAGVAGNRQDQARLWNLAILELWCREWRPA
jgi:asparagine synthase (glutamine-hydrolysing)